MVARQEFTLATAQTQAMELMKPHSLLLIIWKLPHCCIILHFRPRFHKIMEKILTLGKKAQGRIQGGPDGRVPPKKIKCPFLEGKKKYFDQKKKFLKIVF